MLEQLVSKNFQWVVWFQVVANLGPKLMCMTRAVVSKYFLGQCKFTCIKISNLTIYRAASVPCLQTRALFPEKIYWEKKIETLLRLNGKSKVSGNWTKWHLLKWNVKSLTVLKSHDRLQESGPVSVVEINKLDGVAKALKSSVH